ncbi:hypothetical protein KR018_012529 [Drosophila ironensis]|nr:hypothetical protein KR018_012529 [Drosophila ironensis]
MCSLFVLILITWSGVVLMSAKPLDETLTAAGRKPLNQTKIDKMLEELKLLEKMVNETLLAEPTSEGETHLNDGQTAEEANDPTAEETNKIQLGSNNNKGFFVMEVEEEEDDDNDQDDATLDRPTEPVPVQFLRYPDYEPDFKPYPRFAILRNAYVHHMNLEF